MSMTQAEYEATLSSLQTYYRALIADRAAIVGNHTLNNPEVKFEDGGTTLSKHDYLRLLDERIEKARKDIDAHIKLKDTIDAGSQAPWTLETNQEL